MSMIERSWLGWRETASYHIHEVRTAEQPSLGASPATHERHTLQSGAHAPLTGHRPGPSTELRQP